MQACAPAIAGINDPAPLLPPVAPQLRTLAGTLLATLAAGALYEITKQIVSPGISLWASHAMTIAAFGLAATCAVHRALRRQARLGAACHAAEADRIGLADAVAQASDSIVMTDAQGRIEYVNPAFTLLTGYGAPEVIGQNVRVLESGLQSPPFYRDLWSTIRAGKVWHGELFNRRKDGALSLRGHDHHAGQGFNGEYPQVHRG